MILKEVPYNERPREKLLLEGSTKLSNIELLAILLRTGTKGKSSKDLAINILKEIKDINNLNKITLEELQKIDSESALNIHPNNRKRVLRAIQIYLESGKKKSRRPHQS